MHNFLARSYKIYLTRSYMNYYVRLLIWNISRCDLAIFICKIMSLQGLSYKIIQELPCKISNEILKISQLDLDKLIKIMLHYSS